MKYVWRMQIIQKKYGIEAMYPVQVAANTIEEALERAYVAAYKAQRWARKDMSAKFVERLDMQVFV